LGEQQLVGFICFQWHFPSIRVCPITRKTLLHLPQIHAQIQNTKYKVQIQNTKCARLPAQHYCTFHKYIHKYKIQNTKYKYKIQNTKYKIQNTKYARLPAQHNCTFQKYIHKYKIQNTKYKVCPITRTTLLHLPQIHPQIQNTKHKIQNTKYKIQNTK